MIGFSPLDIQLKRSAWLTVALLLAHLVAVACVLLSAIDWRWQLGAVCLICLSAWIASTGRLERVQYARLVWNIDRRHLQLEDLAGRWHDVAKIGRIAITPFLLLLCVRREGRWRDDWLLVTADSVDADSYRRLRVALTLSAGVELPSRDS